MLQIVAFARRTSLGDPAFAPDQDNRVNKIISKAFAHETYKNITDVSRLSPQ
jgi:hypothetical protein